MAERGWDDTAGCGGRRTLRAGEGGAEECAQVANPVQWPWHHFRLKWLLRGQHVFAKGFFFGRGGGVGNIVAQPVADFGHQIVEVIAAA